MKAILVIDMPKTCQDCPCNQIEESYGSIDRTFCGITDNTTSLSDNLKSCPIKPLPHKKNKIKELPQYTKEYEAYCKGEVDGYNQCIDEILGEE